MHITDIEIEGIGGIQSFACSFDRQFNILCGPNGVGKTTVLQVIGHGFSSHTNFLKRNQSAERGSAKMNFVAGAANVSAQYSLKKFDPNGGESISGNVQYAPEVILITTARDFAYSQLNEISRDPPPGEITNRLHSQASVYNPFEIKRWFANRFVFSHIGKSFPVNRLENQMFARSIFEKIDDHFEFDAVDSSTFEVYVKTPTGRIPFEYLSSGFRSCISLIWGLVKEIEYRKGTDDILVSDFDGVVLIDELDMHLHPAWQQKIVGILKGCFPKVQFIVTTHSPFVIQSAAPNEIVVLKQTDERKLVRDRKLVTDVGFAGWTIEEIAHDVLGVLDTRTSAFKSAFSRFQKAVSDENLDSARIAFRELDRMLHPQNVSRELLRAQIDRLEADKGGEE